MTAIYCCCITSCFNACSLPLVVHFLLKTTTHTKYSNEINHCALQDGETLQASARETYIEELDDDESVSESHLTTEAPTVLQTQTPKDKKETSKTKDEFREIKIKVERSVNNFSFLSCEFSNLLPKLLMRMHFRTIISSIFLKMEET